jgi:hypothetical protein
MKAIAKETFSSKKLKIIETVLSIQNEEVLESILELLETRLNILESHNEKVLWKKKLKSSRAGLSISGKELKKVVSDWEKTKDLTEAEFFSRLEDLEDNMEELVCIDAKVQGNQQILLYEKINLLLEEEISVIIIPKKKFNSNDKKYNRLIDCIKEVLKNFDNEWGNLNEWEIKAIQEGLEDSLSGRLVSNETVEKRIEEFIGKL